MPLQLASAACSLRASVFAQLSERMRAIPPDQLLPLHIGDTYRLPPEPARLDRMDLSSSSLYRYSHPFGLAPLLEHLADKLRRANGLSAAAPDWIQITCGATQALHCAALTLFEPGQEVLIMAPFWPLIVGVLKSCGAVPVQVPFSDRLLADPELDIEAYLGQHLTPGTRGFYLANPNNPDGLVYSREQLEAIARFCRAHELWVLSDEVYEDYLFDGRQHVSIASLEGMTERTVTAFSFSKSLAMAGHRLGYAVAPKDIMAVLRRVANHTVYNVSAALQQAALAALEVSEPFLEESRSAYQQGRDLLHPAVCDLCPLPMGGGYVFPALADREQAWQFVHRALDEGLALAPGEAFGEAYGHCLRICFTSVPPERVQVAADLLRRLRG